MSKATTLKCIGNILTLALLMLMPFILFAGTTGKISGVIRDAETNEPLAGANIVIQSTNMGAAADATGHYFIINIPPGTYSIQASMMGYESVRRSEVRVIIDHTTPVDFALKATTLTGEQVVIVANREVVQMDMSATQIAASAEQINVLPNVNKITEYINLQAGIEGENIRGGSLDETQFMMDGLISVDNRTNQPIRLLNLSAVKELSIVKGGFTAEYGNLRSGLINVITKEGTKKFSGSIDFRYRPAGLKHSGESIFNPNNWYLKPYLDPSVAFIGTAKAWDANTRNQYLTFVGWNAVADRFNKDKNPDNDMTPEQARDLFLWLHRAEGSSALGQKEGKYGDRPDWFTDGSLSGPIPFIGKYLGDLTFFASYSEDWQLFALPTSRDYYRQNSGMLKLTSHLSSNLKLNLDALYGEVHTIATDRRGQYYGSEFPYARSGTEILNFSYTDIGNGDIYGLYFPGYFNPYTVYQSMFGISLDHVLSPKTFYNVRISWANIRQRAMEGQELRDPTLVRYFGKYGVDESPFGVVRTPTPMLMEDGMYYGAHGDGAREKSTTTTLNVKFDITSQMNRYNNVKAGIEFNYDDLFSYSEYNRWESTWENRLIQYHHFPYRLAGYIQDKLEFQGLIANVGVRLEYTDPNTDWIITDDKYSKYFRAKYEHLIFVEMPKERAKGHFSIQPRLGISHPISKNAKLFFNYGHYYSMPPTADIYRVNYWRLSDGPYYIGNPSVRRPKTIAYELGWEYNLFEMFLLHISGYYKDVADQTSGSDVNRQTQYTSYDRLVDYRTTENNNFEDTRGFEIQVDKNFGPWVTGWFNYNYMVETSGYTGRRQYFEDPREQAIQGLQNPYLVVPLARPYARASLNITSPADFGPKILGVKPLASIQWNTLFSFKSGRYETWDPLSTYKLKDNLHWKSSYGFDARLSKTFRSMGLNFELFFDIDNLWQNDEGNWANRAFQNDTDKRRYLESLHLPMYKDEIYKNAGYIGGDDRPGMLRPDDVKFDPWEKEKTNPNNDTAIEAENKAIRERNSKREKDKSYIDNPNREFLMYLYPRAFNLGIKIDF